LVRDDSGLSIFKKVVVRKTCEFCDGTGRVDKDEKLHTYFCHTRPIRRPTRIDGGVLEVEQWIGYLLIVALLGYASFLLIKGQSGVSDWPKVTVALMASVILLFVLNHFPAATRFLRWFTLMFFLMIFCGGLALEFALH
jgi:hypothetical protein